ncbi:hypothetical protein F4808DRAFT_263372 [Astrocystis sublimbata]|nr:hypothetical protein F4808DRAFT_263372 [Astrocystis sublimbata]
MDPVNNFCSRWYHQSQVKNDLLFIDGGIETYSRRRPSDKPHDDGLNYTGPITVGTSGVIVVDLSASWDWKTNISEKIVEKTTALGTSNAIPVVQSGVLFQGNPSDPQIYLYGGVTSDINTSFVDWQPPTTSQYSLWGLNTKTFEWTQYDVSLAAPQRPSWGAWAEIPDRNESFYMNGLLSNLSSFSTFNANTSDTTLEGMIVLDLQHHTAANRSTSVITGGSPRTRGGMVYIADIGSSGILISFGGATGDDKSLNPVLMSTIYIYDVNTTSNPDSTDSNNGWWTQNVDGEVPPPRVDFCTVVVSAPDKSSFNVYLYGGWDPTKPDEFDDIWVLSIPSFTWTQVYTGQSPRWGHTCHVVGGRQMITVGGTNNDTYTKHCDWEVCSINVFFLGHLRV